MDFSDIAIVILNWNGVHFLQRFLPSVCAHSGNAQLYVIDNCSTDSSLAFLKEHYPTIRCVINNGNEGFAKGYNDGLKHIQATYYVLLNSDVEVSPNWLAPLKTAMEKHPELAAVQPKIKAIHDREAFEYAGACGGYIDVYGYPFCRGRVFTDLETDQGQYNEPLEIFWASGACLFIRAELFHAIGGFDDSYFAHMEEIDLCWRLKNKGYYLQCIPSSTVYHVGGGTLNKNSPRKCFLNFRNNLHTFLKNHAGQYLWMKILFRLMLDGIAGIKFLLEGNPTFTWAVIKAHFAFYARIPRILKQRKALQSDASYQPTQTAILNANLVTEYYAKQKKHFSDLAPHILFKKFES